MQLLAQSEFLDLIRNPWVAYPLVLVGAMAAAFVNAIAGGGTFLSFPALTGIGRLTEKSANMTSTVGIWPGSVTSIYAARADYKFIPRTMLLTFGVISLVGGLVGSVLLVVTPSKAFVQVIPWLLGFATVVFAFSKPIARWAGRQHGHRSLKWTALVAMIQLFVAIYGGYFGAGIGVLMLAGLSFVGLDSIHHMNALKVLLGTIINGVSIIVFVIFSAGMTSPAERLNWGYAGGMAIAAAVGGLLGMRVARGIKPDSLRYLVLVIGVVLTAAYGYKAAMA